MMQLLLLNENGSFARKGFHFHKPSRRFHQLSLVYRWKEILVKRLLIHSQIRYFLRRCKFRQRYFPHSTAFDKWI